eukprot:TRINITY_DN7668_c0_g1_i1.p1 TRINITY_DN7668_c0_g1~~TRINITY_DN7668_c0_g1_i1.p1  ORF type:complete len:180 (-),score=43.46 TRINITY_DN7668_c0_g1_i1:175-714(-)
MTTLYNITKKFRETVRQINSLDLGVFQTEVLEKLASDKDKEIPDQYREVSDLVKHISERAAQQQASIEKVVGELQQLIDEDKLKNILRYYQLFSQKLLKKLDRSPVVPLHLDDVSWRLHLRLSDDRLSKLLSPTALFQFKLTGPDGTLKDNHLLEFDHENLYDFFNQLEDIQEQLDALS